MDGWENKSFFLKRGGGGGSSKSKLIDKFIYVCMSACAYIGVCVQCENVCACKGLCAPDCVLVYVSTNLWLCGCLDVQWCR